MLDTRCSILDQTQSDRATRIESSKQMLRRSLSVLVLELCQSEEEDDDEHENVGVRLTIMAVLSIVAP
jgi:hypothetical protein